MKFKKLIIVLVGIAIFAALTYYNAFYVNPYQLKVREEYSFDDVPFDTSIKKENPVEHAIMVKASECDDSGLVG